MRGDNLKEERLIVFTAPRVVQTFDTMAQCCYLQVYRQELLIWFPYTFSNMLLHVYSLCVVYEHVCMYRCTYLYMCVQRGTLLSHSHHIPLRQSLVGPRAKQGARHINPPVSAPYNAVFTDVGVAISSFLQGCWGLNLRFSCLCSENSYPPSHLSNISWCFE